VDFDANSFRRVMKMKSDHSKQFTEVSMRGPKCIIEQLVIIEQRGRVTSINVQTHFHLGRREKSAVEE
jgi:hypothetical protein